MRTSSLFVVVPLIFSFPISGASADVRAANAPVRSATQSMGDGHPQTDNAETYSGTGVVKAWSGTTVSLAHHPIPQLNWPAMTMSFDLDSYQGPAFPVGQQIEFKFKQTRSGYALVSADAK